MTRASRHSLERALLASAFALALAVIVASALMRHLQAGAGCADWPACYGTVSALQQAQASTTLAIARGVHRATASGVLVLLLSMLALAWRRSALREPNARYAQIALAIALALAAIGVVAGASRAPGVVLANLLGGFGIAAALAASLRAGARRPGASKPARNAAMIALVLVVAQAAIGGLIGAQNAAQACGLGDDCAPWTWPQGMAAFDLARSPALAGGAFVAHPGGAALHALHRVLGALILVALVGTAALARDPLREASRTLVTLGVIEAGLGIALPATGLPLVAVLLHNAAAALLAVVLVHVAVHPAGAPRSAAASAARSACRA